MSVTRRIFLKALLIMGAMMTALPRLRGRSAIAGSLVNNPGHTSAQPESIPGPLGVDADGFSRVFLARHGTPEQNIEKVIELMGGIEQFAGPQDIVVLKPNAQWWRQGMTNTDAMKGFIEMVLAVPGFSGEVIVAENHQFAGADSRGWTTTERNGRFNLNELVEHFQSRGHSNVTKYHWKVGGTASLILQGDAQGDRRVTGPWDGDGYVWLDDTYYRSPSGRKCLMTYPVFTSAYSGITIDLKHGAWFEGRYLPDRNVRFINFSALNHHSRYCGVTASVKNFMGVVDMTCGWPGDGPRGTYNTHHVGISKRITWRGKRLLWRFARDHRFVDHCHRNFHHTGGALGSFMRHVRMPDLNIITAEWVGWGSRTDTDKSFRPRAILASRDPVALDYVAARDILYQGTPADAMRPEGDLTYRELNDPDRSNGPFRKFIEETARQGIGTLDAAKIEVIDHRFDS